MKGQWGDCMKHFKDLNRYIKRAVVKNRRDFRVSLYFKKDQALESIIIDFKEDEIEEPDLSGMQDYIG